MDVSKPRTDPKFLSEMQLNLRSQAWRIRNLYRCRPKEPGQPLQEFRPWPEQDRFLREMWKRNLWLKPRGSGGSALTCCIGLDSALFRPNFKTAIVAHTDDKAVEMFQEHVLPMYENFPYPNLIPRIRPGTFGSQSQLMFDNGSSIEVHVSLRGGSYHMVHSTEFGYVSAYEPSKAKEFISGGLPALRSQDGILIMESTAEGGPHGLFHSLCMKHRQINDEISSGARRRSSGDWKFFFSPWFADPQKSRREEFPVDKEHADYFDFMEQKLNVKIRNEQRWWYCWQAMGEGQEIAGTMKGNFPSTVEEAFQAFIMDAYFATALSKAGKEGRIGKFKYDANYPIDTWWDIGLDCTSIWFSQTIGNTINFIWYYENKGYELPFYVDYLNGAQCKFPWSPTRYRYHVAPHDIGKRDFMTVDRLMDRAQTATGIRFERTQRVADVQMAIQQGIVFMQRCHFDQENCSLGIKRLQEFKPRRERGSDVARHRPLHDMASHGSSAYLQCSGNHDKILSQSSDVSSVTITRQSGALM